MFYFKCVNSYKSATGVVLMGMLNPERNGTDPTYQGQSYLGSLNKRKEAIIFQRILLKYFDFRNELYF